MHLRVLGQNITGIDTLDKKSSAMWCAHWNLECA